MLVCPRCLTGWEFGAPAFICPDCQVKLVDMDWSDVVTKVIDGEVVYESKAKGYEGSS